MVETSLEMTGFTVGIEDGTGAAIIHCKSEDGQRFTIKLGTMAMQTMASFLAEAFSQVAAQPGSQHRLAPNVDRIAVELGTKQGTDILRIFVAPHVYHEYAARSDTDLGQCFRGLAVLIAQGREVQSAPGPTH